MGWPKNKHILNDTLPYMPTLLTALYTYIILKLSYLSKVTLFFCNTKWIPTERYVTLLFLIYIIKIILKTYLIYFNSYDKIKTFY